MKIIYNINTVQKIRQQLKEIIVIYQGLIVHIDNEYCSISILICLYTLATTTAAAGGSGQPVTIKMLMPAITAAGNNHIFFKAAENFTILYKTINEQRVIV